MAEMRKRRSDPAKGKGDPAPAPAPAPALAAAAAGGGRLRKMFVRTATALVLLAAGLTVVMVFGHLGWCVMIVAVQTLVFRELVDLRYKEAKEKGIPLFRTLQWLWFVTAMTWSYSRSWLKAPMGFFDQLATLREYTRASTFVTDEWAVVDMINFAMYSFAFVASVLCFRKGLYSYQLKQLSWTLLTLCFVVVQLKCIVYTAHVGLIWSMFPVSMIMMNDTAAYFVGQAIGKRITSMPFLELSPNKTWEGFFGGGVCTVIYAYAATSLWAGLATLRCTFPEVQAAHSAAVAGTDGTYAGLELGQCQNDHLFQGAVVTVGDGYSATAAQCIFIGLAVFGSTIAPFGGFAASATKRAFKIKDFDSVIPGHGGFTDRMDCQFIMGMAAWVAYTTFVSHPYLNVPYDRIEMAAAQLDPTDQQRLADKLMALLANPK